MRTNKKGYWVGAALAASALVLAGCSSGDDAGDAGGSTDGADSTEESAASDDSMDDSADTEASGEEIVLNVATVNNGQMKDMESLRGEYEALNPGVTVNFQVMEEGDLRNSVTADVASGAGQYDIVTIGAYETPQWGANGWLVDLTPYLEADPDYDVEDILPPVRDAISYNGQQFAVPFYGESSILMYNKEIMDAAGITVPNNPTWPEIREIAAQVNSDDVDGICMRGKPGWGDLFAPLTTVVQTFGGGWYDLGWNATVDTPEWREAVTFYKEMLDDSGQDDPVSYSFNECLTLLKNGETAMWADASVAASMLEADDSPVKGKMGYAHMPVVETAESGWLWSWNLAIPSSTKQVDAAADFVMWATSKDYHQLVGEELGWSLVPPGARISTYEIPEYQEAAAAYAPITLDVMSAVNPVQPGVNPQPWVGVQYVAIPEFQDVGNQCAQLMADYIADRTSIDDALASCQEIAQEAGDAQK